MFYVIQNTSNIMNICRRTIVSSNVEVNVISQINLEIWCEDDGDNKFKNMTKHINHRNNVDHRDEIYFSKIYEKSALLIIVLGCIWLAILNYYSRTKLDKNYNILNVSNPTIINKLNNIYLTYFYSRSLYINIYI